MKKLNNKVNYGDKVLTHMEVLNLKNPACNHWMDAECVDLCDTLNSIKGIKTIESCCGHNYESYRIFFKCYDLPALRFIQSCIDKRYWAYGGQWKIFTSISDVGPEPLDFVLESTSTNLNEIMLQVEDMIRVLNYYLNHKNRFELLGLDYANFIFEEVKEEIENL